MTPQKEDLVEIAPSEATQLLVEENGNNNNNKDRHDGADDDGGGSNRNKSRADGIMGWIVIASLIILAVCFVVYRTINKDRSSSSSSSTRTTTNTTTAATTTNTSSSSLPLGPYKLVQCQEGHNFFDYYHFYAGTDSLGSAGYNTYVDKERALELGIINVTKETIPTTTEGTNGEQKSHDYVYMQSSAAVGAGEDDSDSAHFRESIRIEGNDRFDRGMFILDVEHVPLGCGVWPAFWMTDEENWPDNGEIDIVEGINYQNVAKTALHTSESCSMYAQDPWWEIQNGVWDRATGIPNRYTGKPDTLTNLPADNCWYMAPHEWYNEGCVASNTVNGTLGQEFNDNHGGVFVLEWDPANGYIKSWVFTKVTDEVPSNLRDAMNTASNTNPQERVMPDPSSWHKEDGPGLALPYAYFHIGESSGCSSDHFKNMHLVFNLAFCGMVSGNRFVTDCPIKANEFGVPWEEGSDTLNPVATCNAYMRTNPKEIDEQAYWKIRGVYVYEREYV